MDDLTIVDADHHLWDLKRLRYPWLEGESDQRCAEFDLIFNTFKQVVAGFPRADQKKLFSENAMRFYRIEP